MSQHELMRFFQYTHLPDHLQAASKPFYELADRLTQMLPPCGELDHAMRKLLEAKDCAVRALLSK